MSTSPAARLRTAPIFIFDLDGTLADDRHRRHHIQRDDGKPKDWKAYFAACIHDGVHAHTRRVLHSLQAEGAEIWIFTGRSDTTRPDTLRWIKDNIVSTGPGMYPQRICMRQENDRTPDTLLKIGWLRECPQHEQSRVAAVFEDRARVVAAWRAAGVPCYQVEDANF